MMMDEVDEFAGKTENKMKRPGEASSPTSSKRKRSLALQLMKWEGEGDSPLQGAAGSKETDTTDIHDIHEKKPENDETSSAFTKMPTLETMSSTLQRGPQKVNDHIKCQLMKEIRKFGRKYERIFILLEDVQGPPEVKKQFIEFTIKEAKRFKRWHLIKHLEKLQEEIASD
ncbi:integrator complex subunit 6-like [Tamandua tetradactyla]|uniref:integrator complex subunit 6-like n=1 Tax=Tamandua tetradactyla TaxID=48850 RepID=UPI00405495B0